MQNMDLFLDLEFLQHHDHLHQDKHNSGVVGNLQHKNL